MNTRSTVLGIQASTYPSPHSLGNKIARVLWTLACAIAFRCTPKPFYAWRRLLLRIFGAKLAAGTIIHANVRIWAPWNLEMEDHACLAPSVDCYNVAPIRIGARTTVSQYSYLCAATHDYTKRGLPLKPAPISIGSDVWICADVFIGPGVTVGEGAVVGARSSVYKDIQPFVVVAGNPAKVLKKRVVED